MSTLFRPEHKIGILVRYLGPNDRLGSRVALSLPYWDNRRVVFSWDYRKAPDTLGQACAWLNERGIEVEGFTTGSDDYTVVCHWSQRQAIFKAWGIPEVTP